MTLMAVNATGKPAKKRKPWYRRPVEPKPQPEAIPVHMVLERLDKICKEEGYWAKAEIYVSAVGPMLQFKAVTRLLTDENLKALEQLRMVIFGTLYVGPCQENGKPPAGAQGVEFRMVEVTLRTNRAVKVIPIPRQTT